MAKPKHAYTLELRVAALEGLVARQAQRITRLERKWRRKADGSRPTSDRRPGPGARNYEGTRGRGQHRR